MSTAVATVRRNNQVFAWLAFAIQAAIAVSIEVSDDLARGLISQHGTAQGIQNAREVVTFEAAHGLWIEPAWQSFFQHTHSILAFAFTWPEVVRVMNGIYVFGHIFVTLGVALWVYAYRRKVFPYLRNIIILTNLLALVLYEAFPVAPPRLTTGLVFNHHPFVFQDTVYGVVSSSGKLLGASAGYNEFSAMPSIHMAWALVAAAAVFIMAKPLIAKALAVVYPGLMLMAIVVTGNHFLLDAIAAALIVCVAAVIAGAFERWKARHPLPNFWRWAAEALTQPELKTAR